MRNGKIEQYVVISTTETSVVSFPVNFTTTKYYAIGCCYNNDTGMTSQVWETQIFPQKYDYSKITFGGTSSIQRRVFATGY